MSKTLNVPPHVINFFSVNPALTQDGASFSSTSRFAGSQSTRPKNRGKVTLLNESIITLLLKLHSKYSGKPDSYVALGKRSGPSVTKEYRESRVGDACFFIEKVLDRIHEMDEACAESIEASRKIVWPDHHKQEARVEEEAERRETEMKKKKAKVGRDAIVLGKYPWMKSRGRFLKSENFNLGLQNMPIDGTKRQGKS